MDYDGPELVSQHVLCGELVPKDQLSFQPPSSPNTRREVARRPSEKGLILNATKAE